MANSYQLDYARAYDPEEYERLLKVARTQQHKYDKRKRARKIAAFKAAGDEKGLATYLRQSAAGKQAVLRRLMRGEPVGRRRMEA